MTAMTCKLSGLFSIGEDFDDEDLLRTDWPLSAASGPADVAAAVTSCALRPSSVACREPVKNGPQKSGERSAVLCNGTASRSGTHMANTATATAAMAAAGQTVASSLRALSSSSSSSSSAARAPSLRPPALDICQPNLASHQSRPGAEMQQKPHVAQDDFDDWDIDLADLDECDRQMEQPPPPLQPPPTVQHVAKALRPPTCVGIQRQGPALPIRGAPAAHSQYPKPRPSFPSAPQQRFPGSSAASPAPSPLSRIRPQQPQTQWPTPGPSHQTRGLFETLSPAPSASPSPSATSVSSPTPNSHPLHTPLLTNRLVRLVSASNKLPKKRPRSEPRQPRTRRFPGPAGFLPQQMQDQNLDDIVVSVPQTPAHGAMARSPSQGCSSQSEEEDFRCGGWLAMKVEMGLDERNPSCFLHSYSIVMVLRKAALKQLAKNKVPNMAVLLKSIICTHADAKAVFKDPTGEIQGTVHRRLLEDRVGELKVGAVLLLKQVGVFSPSHRSCYLNVTPNNLLKIYSHDGASPSSQPPSLVPEPSPGCSRGVLREPLCQMQLVFDDDDDDCDDEGQDGDRNSEHGKTAQTLSDGKVHGRSCPQEPAGNPPSLDWDADDDLDELLGELPEDTYSI